MDERVVQFRVGVMVLASLIITGILALLFGELPSALRGGYVIYIKFASAPGVSQDTPVRKSGQPIGRVTKVEFAPDNEVLVTARINGNVDLYCDEAVRIKTGLLGDAEMEFVPGSKRPTKRVRIKPGDLLVGTVMVDPLQAFADLEGNLTRAFTALGDAGNEVAKLAKSLNDQVNTNDFSRVMNETEGALKSFQKSMADVDDIIGDENVKRDLKKAASDLPKVLADTRETMSGFQKTVALANENLRNVQTFTGALDKQGENIIGNMSQSVERLDELLGQMNRFSRQLNSREGSLGQLVSNPDLYNNLSQAAENVNKLTRKLEPILCDARVITDKIARNPGIILRDAVQPGPGIK